VKKKEKIIWTPGFIFYQLDNLKFNWLLSTSRKTVTLTIAPTSLKSKKCFTEFAFKCFLGISLQ